MSSCSTSSSIASPSIVEGLLAAEQVHRHALDRADVDEGVAGLRSVSSELGITFGSNVLVPKSSCWKRCE